MHNPATMRVIERQSNLAAEFDEACFCESTVSRGSCFQRFAFDEFHRDERCCLDNTGIEDLHNVRMLAELGDRLTFVDEPFRSVRILKLHRDRLQRALTLQVAVDGKKHHTHGAPAKLSRDIVRTKFAAHVREFNHIAGDYRLMVLTKVFRAYKSTAAVGAAWKINLSGNVRQLRPDTNSSKRKHSDEKLGPIPPTRSLSDSEEVPP